MTGTILLYVGLVFLAGFALGYFVALRLTLRNIRSLYKEWERNARNEARHEHWGRN